MQFFLQLNSNENPNDLKSIFGDGLLQLFYCTENDGFCPKSDDQYSAFSASHCVRLINIDYLHKEIFSAPSPQEEFVVFCLKEFECKLISGWKEEKDFPSQSECFDLGIDDDIYENIEESMMVKSGEKLSGWPLWVQDLEYPSCPICNKRMEFIFQVDSEVNIKFMFGDVGCGQITQCTNHKEVLAFGWACG